MYLDAAPQRAWRDPQYSATGVISADVAVPTVPYPRNFLVTGTVTATVDGSPKDFSVSLRVHVHTSVSQVFLSPPSLTVRFETTGAFKSSVGFSVLAKFNDNLIGDITRHGDPDNATTRLTWQNQSPSLIDMVNPTDATNGSFVAKISPPAGTAAFMQVQLPNELGSLNAVNPGQILFGEDWAKQRTIVPVSGSASTTPTDDALNLLLLPRRIRRRRGGRVQSVRAELHHEMAEHEVVRSLRSHADRHVHGLD